MKITPTELYGFMTWIVSAAFGIIFCIWAITPDAVLNDMGIYYLPQRYYINGFASWFGVSVLAFELIAIGLSLSSSHDRDSYLTMQDKFTKLRAPAKN